MSDQQTKRCIYCDEHKLPDQFSLEHIFPDSLGGSLCSDLFKTRDVCERCNNLMGLFVDGPLIKNWFTKNAEAFAYRQFVDMQSVQSWLPFNYMGLSDFLNLGHTEVCEIWAGPFGEHVYHIHVADDVRYNTYVGGNPIARRAEPGRAYIFLTVTEPTKYSLTIRSFARQFKGVARYAGNFEIQNDAEFRFVNQPSNDRADELTKIRAKIAENKQWQIQLRIPVDFEHRFLAKFARGLGFKLFGERYLDTPYAIGLKSALWGKDAEVREGLIKGTSYFSEGSNKLNGLVGLSGVYSILLWAMAGNFFVVLMLPDGHHISVVISDDPGIWSGEEFEQYKNGLIYLIAPQVDVFIGPIELPIFLARKVGNIKIDEIEVLESKRIITTVQS